MSNNNSLNVVAHCATPFLHPDGSWIYAQIAAQRRYRPIVITQEARNLDQFCVNNLYSSEDYGLPRNCINRVVRRLTGQYPFYVEILRRERARLIHAHFGYQGYRCLGARRRSGLPLITSFYGADATRYPRLRGWRRRYRQLFAAGELFLVEGSRIRSTLVELGCPAAKVRVHHIGVDLKKIPYRQREASHHPRFLICSPFREKKGIPYALEALGLLRRMRPNFDFDIVVIGDGPDRDRIRLIAARSGLADRIQWRGVLPYASVVDELARADILLQTSVLAVDGDSEGGAPVILLDAQAAGVPVVASRHADIPEYVVDGKSGLLVPERDVREIFRCLSTLLDEPHRWASMGAAGRRHVEKHYNAQRQVERLEAVYDELLAAESSLSEG